MNGMKRGISLLLLLLTGGLGTGCVHAEDVNESYVDSTPAAPPEVTVEREVEIGADEPGDPADPPPPSGVLVWSPISLRPPREPALFRLGAGLGALGHIDLNPCRDEGLLRGYVHMHLTFRHTGRVVRAAVETPVAPPPQALSCIGDQIEATEVPTFDGGDVMLSKSVFVN
ncbi:MAG TPA: hypothetical protein VH044_00565 [Polyangiaceae bacterium]|nr:hypothetical protein [Polyangiaceae bacterium]